MYLITKVRGVSDKQVDDRINDVFSGISELRRAIKVIERDIMSNNYYNKLSYAYVFWSEDNDNPDGWFAIEAGESIYGCHISGCGRVYDRIGEAIKYIFKKDAVSDRIWNNPKDDDSYVYFNESSISTTENLWNTASMIDYALSHLETCEENHYDPEFAKKHNLSYWFDED